MQGGRRGSSETGLCGYVPSPTVMVFEFILGLNKVIDLIFSYEVTQTARLILREEVDFARQQPDRNRQNRAATVHSCFVLIGTRQHGVAVLYETSNRVTITVTVYFWLIWSLVDPTSTSSIIVRGPLQFSRLLMK